MPGMRVLFSPALFCAGPTQWATQWLKVGDGEEPVRTGGGLVGISPGCGQSGVRMKCLSSTRSKLVRTVGSNTLHTETLFSSLHVLSMGFYEVTTCENSDDHAAMICHI